MMSACRLDVDQVRADLDLARVRVVAERARGHGQPRRRSHLLGSDLLLLAAATRVVAEVDDHVASLGEAPGTRLRISSLGSYDCGVGFNRVTWTPGHDHKPIGASRFRQLARLRRQREARARETAAAHALKGLLMSLAALLGSEVR